MLCVFYGAIDSFSWAFLYCPRYIEIFMVRFCVTALCDRGKIVCKSADIVLRVNEWVIEFRDPVFPCFAVATIIVEFHGGGLDKSVLFFLPQMTPITTKFPFLHLGHILVLV